MGNSISEVLKIKLFRGSMPPHFLEAREFSDRFATPSCAYLNGKTTLRPCFGALARLACAGVRFAFSGSGNSAVGKNPANKQQANACTSRYLVLVSEME